jgi:hypothetical protein
VSLPPIVNWRVFWMPLPVNMAIVPTFGAALTFAVAGGAAADLAAAGVLLAAARPPLLPDGKVLPLTAAPMTMSAMQPRARTRMTLPSPRLGFRRRGPRGWYCGCRGCRGW